MLGWRGAVLGIAGLLATAAPLGAADPALVAAATSRIDSKAFTADEASRDAGPDHALEHATEDVSVAEALVASA
jgi:hypothetical protein